MMPRPDLPGSSIVETEINSTNLMFTGKPLLRDWGVRLMPVVGSAFLIIEPMGLHTLQARY
jgi:hypothetical protein